MLLETLNCPKCGAPLNAPLNAPPHSGVWLCLYCNSLVRTQPAATLGVAPAEAAPATVEKTLSAEDLEPIKQLLVAGQRDEAVQRYQQLAGCSLAEAQETLDRLGKQFALDTIRHQLLTRFGMIVTGLSLVALVGSVAAGLTGRLHPALVGAFAAFAGLQLLVFWPALLTTLRYSLARSAPAAVLNFATIGQVGLRNQQVHVFRLWLEVRPSAEPPFRTELTVPVRESHLPEMHQGARMQVKVLPGEPHDVIFERRLES